MRGTGAYGRAAPRLVALLLAVGLLVLAGAPSGLLAAGLAGALLGLGARRLLDARQGVAPAPSAGIPVDAGSEPDILRLVRLAAGAVRARAPGDVRITLDAAVALCRDGRGTVLSIGAPWLAATARADLVVAVAHALAGGPRAMAPAEERPDGGGWAVRARRPLERRAGGLRDATGRRRLAAADRACVEAFGSEALDSYLRAAFRRDYFTAYLAGDVEPCLADGFAPPILEGWAVLVAQPWFAELAAEGLADARLSERSERVVAAAARGVPPPVGAVVLATPARLLECRLLTASHPECGVLVDLGWDRVADVVWLPRLRQRVAAGSGGFEPFRLGRIAEAMAGPAGTGAPDPRARVETVSATLAGALLEQGWTLAVPVGSPIQLRRGELTIEPLELCAAACAGTLPAAEWAYFAEEAAVADLLVVPVRPAAPGPARGRGPGAGPGLRRSAPRGLPRASGRWRRRRPAG